MSQKGVLLVNLGSPDSPSVPDVRRYLREFLMDGRVLDAPWPIRFAIVHFAILPSRPAQSAEAYEKIWGADGAPLIATSRKLQSQLQARFPFPVELAMRYQNPSIDDAIRRLQTAGVTDLLLIPLFPHYAMSSYETAVERVKVGLRKFAPGMRLEVVPPYYDHPDFIRALVASASEYLAQGYDHLLFSFHGLPERHLRKSDPTGQHCLRRPDCCEVSSPAHATCYRWQCFRTVQAFTQAAGVKRYSVAFQSRLGRDPWMQPFTDMEMQRLARAGVSKLLVMCPAFVADCLETIEEIGLRGKETFREAGGKELVMVPCVNTRPEWVQAVANMIERFTRSGQAEPRVGQPA